jgi:hypothetical protein
MVSLRVVKVPRFDPLTISIPLSLQAPGTTAIPNRLLQNIRKKLSILRFDASGQAVAAVGEVSFVDGRPGAEA